MTSLRFTEKQDGLGRKSSGGKCSATSISKPSRNPSANYQGEGMTKPSAFNLAATKFDSAFGVSKIMAPVRQRDHRVLRLSMRGRVLSLRTNGEGRVRISTRGFIPKGVGLTMTH